MMSSMVQTILDLHHQYPNKTRFDCFECNRSNSLSINETDGHIRYRCFGASCRIKGTYKTGLSIETIRNNRTLGSIGNTTNSVSSSFNVPDYWVSPINRTACKEYMERNHVLGAYINERVHLKYDPKQDRIVFLIYDDKGNIVNATGRSLTRRIPKWFIYGKAETPFVAGNKDVAVIVEDCASASAISHICTGIALLGTNFKETNLSILKRYKRVIISLDKDAVRKACEIEASIRFFASTSILLLNEDLKALDEQHLYELLGTRYDIQNAKEL